MTGGMHNHEESVQAKKITDIITKIKEAQSDIEKAFKSIESVNIDEFENHLRVEEIVKPILKDYQDKLFRRLKKYEDKKQSSQLLDELERLVQIIVFLLKVAKDLSHSLLQDQELMRNIYLTVFQAHFDHNLLT